MRRVGFHIRLILAAIIWISAGLGVSWFAIDALIRDHVIDEFKEELSHHGTELAGLVEIDPNRTMRLRQPLSDHRFYEPGSGQYWQIEQPGGATLRSPSLGEFHLPPPTGLAQDGMMEGVGPTGKLFLYETDIRPAGSDAPARLRLGIDERLVSVFLRRFDWMLGLSLFAIALGLCAAVVAQVTYGLWPLTRIRQSLLAIRRGDARRLPDDLPAEIAPLTNSLNDMIEANDEVVRRARTQAGNLAHALKTPLAILMDEATRLDAAGHDGSIVLRECERMQRQIDYQMTKARATAARGRAYATAPVLPAIRRIVSAMSRLRSAGHLTFEIDDAACDVSVMCDAEDLDEILGNLIDNAVKWAASRVRESVSATPGGPARVDVEDDGPGMPEAARTRVFALGERLDERVPGTGLGLTIVRDVAELYGGRAWIDASRLGGAAAHVELPVVRLP